MTESNSGNVIGRIAGTADATPLKFHVAIAEDRYLQLDDVVATAREVQGHGPILIAGIVTDVVSRHEGASFGSDVFLIADGVLPAQVQEIAEVTTTRVEPEWYVPPRPSAPAHRATGDERAQALYFDQMERRVAVGTARDGELIYLNMDFLDGTRGAHVNISGISGVATKTSFALFLLHSIFRGGVLSTRIRSPSPSAHNSSAIAPDGHLNHMLLMEVGETTSALFTNARIRQGPHAG